MPMQTTIPSALAVAPLFRSASLLSVRPAACGARRIGGSRRAAGESGSARRALRAARGVDLARERRRRRARRSAADASFDHAEALARAPAGVRSTPEGSAGSRLARLSALAFARPRSASASARRSTTSTRSPRGCARRASTSIRFRTAARASASAAARRQSSRAFATVAALLPRGHREAHRERIRRRDSGRVRRCDPVGRGSRSRCATGRRCTRARRSRRGRFDATGRRRIVPAGPSPARTTFSRPISRSSTISIRSISRAFNGTGQTIAVVGRSRVYQPRHRRISSRCSAWPRARRRRSFRRTAPIPARRYRPAPIPRHPDCGNPTDQVGDQTEATLDVQRANGTAPGATIDLVVSGQTNSVDGVDIATDYAIDTDPVPAKILSISFTLLRSRQRPHRRRIARSVFLGQAAAEGISVFVASGDAGVAGCASLDAGADSRASRSSTNVLCSSQYVTCVGGTEFADDRESGRVLALDGRRGISFRRSATFPKARGTNRSMTTAHPQLAASGGGFSAYMPKPSWQTGTGVPGTQAATRRMSRCMHRRAKAISLALPPQKAVRASSRTGALHVHRRRRHVRVDAGHRRHRRAPEPEDRRRARQPQSAPLLSSRRIRAPRRSTTSPSQSRVSGCTLAVPSMCNNSTPGPTGLTGGLAGYLVGTGYDEATGPRLGRRDESRDALERERQLRSISTRSASRGSWYNPSTAAKASSCRSCRISTARARDSCSAAGSRST